MTSSSLTMIFLRQRPMVAFLRFGSERLAGREWTRAVHHGKKNQVKVCVYIYMYYMLRVFRTKNAAREVCLGLLGAEPSVHLCRDSNHLPKVKLGGEGWGEGGASRQQSSPGWEPAGANPGKRGLWSGHGL